MGRPEPATRAEAKKSATALTPPYSLLEQQIIAKGYHV
jgi:hypothetical protein